jgi:HEAT repeat protein
MIMKMNKTSLLTAAVIFSIAILGYSNGRTQTAEEIKGLIQEVSKYQSGETAEPLKKIESLVRDVRNNPDKKQQVEKILAGILAADSTIEARKFACQQLAIIGPESSLMILSQIASLEPTAGVACMAIVNSPSTNALEALKIAYNQGNSYVKLQAVNSIGNLNWQKFGSISENAVSFLKSVLNEKDKQLVEAALTSLGKIGTKSATDVIIAFKLNRWNEFADAISDALLRCAEKAVANNRINDARTIYEGLFSEKVSPQIKRAIFIGLVKTDSDGGLSRIEQTILGPDTPLKATAISMLPAIKKSSVSDKISSLFQSVGKNEQILLIDALAEINDSTAVKVIEKAAESPDKEIRIAALSAIGKVGSSQHVPLLIKALNEATDPPSSQIIEQALATLKGGDLTDAAILKELKSSPAKTRIINVLTRRFSLRPESKVFASDGFKTMLEIAVSDDEASARAAFRALGKLCSERELPQLLDALVGIKTAQIRTEAENAIAAVIEKIPSKINCANLVCGYVVKTTNPEVKISFINLLPVCGGAEALSTAKASYASTDSRIKEAGLRALAEWKDISAWDALFKVYEKPDSEAFRVLALRGLVRLLNEENIRPDEKLVDYYSKLFNFAKTASDKKMIIGALGNCAHREALYLALEKVSDPDIKAEAIEAVKRIANAIKSKYPKDAAQALEKIK